MTVKELAEKRALITKQAREILDKADAESRALSTDEQRKWDEAMAEVDGLKAKIDARNRVDAIDAENAAAQAAQIEAQRKVQPPQPGTPPNTNDEVRRLPGESAHVFESRKRRSTDDYMSAFRGFLAGGFPGMGVHARALQADVDVVGGYLIMPQQFVNQLIKFVDDMLWFRTKATVITLTNAQSCGAPSLETDPDDADWTAELLTGNADSAMAFGKRELFPHPIAKRIKVSNKLLSLAMMQPESMVKARLGYKFGVTQEKAFMTGTGQNQPLGVFTASAHGISTGRDVTCGTTTAITGDGLFDMKYSLKQQYQKTAEWTFSRPAVKQIRKLKDGEGQYLWNPGLTGTPDTLLDRPVNQSEFAPSTFTTGQYVAMLGDYSHYWIAQASELAIQRLVELYAETNQVGFIGRMELDGMPALEEAFARGKLA